MFEKYLKAAKTLLELAKDRGFPIYSTYVNSNLFKQKYEVLKTHCENIGTNIEDIKVSTHVFVEEETTAASVISEIVVGAL